jgi:hypothetical protein
VGKYVVAAPFRLRTGTHHYAHAVTYTYLPSYVLTYGRKDSPHCRCISAFERRFSELEVQVHIDVIILHASTCVHVSK